MNKLFTILKYYILLLIGLAMTSWIIWSRFLRQRVIRNIPDELLTEYRFWILLYICWIYFYVVKSLIKEHKSHIIVISISNIIGYYFWKPLTTLDHFIKYNTYCKTSYYNFMMRMQKYWDELPERWHYSVILGFQIIPRIILVSFLLVDTFYFQKVELFYKVVLIGLLPFAFRYIQYCFEDFYDYLVKQLTDKYDLVMMYEKGYSGRLSHKDTTNAIWHYESVSVELYIEIIYVTRLENARDKTSIEYVAEPLSKDHVCIKYEQEINKPMANWTRKDYEELNKLFFELSPKIHSLKLTRELFQNLKQQKKVKYPKIIIFSMYFICWSYILLISYNNYPIELPMFKYLITNFMNYLINGDLFTDHLYSVNENLITIQNVKCLIIKIIIAIKNSIIK